MRVGVGLSERPDPVEAISEAAGRAQLGARAGKGNAALVWITHHHADAVEPVLHLLRRQLGIERIVGAVVPGVMAEDREVFDAPGVAVMSFHDPDPWRFTTMLIRDLSDRNPAAAQALAAATKPGDLAVAMMSTASFQPRAFEGALARAGRTGTLVGGGAVNVEGPDWVFTEWGPHGDALAALVIRGCDPTVGLAHSCRTLSRALPVTAANGRMLAALSGRPAAKVLHSVIKRAELSDEDLGRRVLVALTESPSPLSLARGEYVVRPLLGVEQSTGALYLGGDVEAGEYLCFVLRDREHARAEVNGMALELAAGCAAPGVPSFALAVNCSGRGPAFQGIPEHDAPVLRALLPPAPMAGFFSGFELAPLPRHPASVHLFCCSVALGW